MLSWKQLTKNISKIENGFDYSQSNKQFWYQFYIDFFVKLITNYFEWVDLPKTVDEIWLEKNLCYKGFVGWYIHPEFGLVASNGAMGLGLDNYDNPLTFKPVNNSMFKFPNSIYINWYEDMLDPEKAVIVGNNNFYSPSFEWIRGFALKLADIEQTIQLNRNAQIKPFIVITDHDSKFSMKNMWNKIINGDPVVYVNRKKNTSGGLDVVQLEDMVHVLDTKTDIILDKLHDEKQRVINQLLTVIGINNNAVDKAERLVAAEATSNNGLINACIQVNLKARREGIERVNRCWGPKGLNPQFEKDIKVRPAVQIEEFNTEKVMKNIDSEIDDFYREAEEVG